MKPTIDNILYMLKESNAIEGEYDQQQLDDALEAWDFLIDNSGIKMTPVLIKQTHSILMKNKYDISKKHKGDFRDVPVWIGGDKKDQPKIVIERQIEQWCEHVNSTDKNHDPIHCHLEFENIHPFIDGNGRMGRMLLNWHLVNRNKAPLLVYTEADRHTYYMLFESYRKRHYDKLWNTLIRDWRQ